MRKNQDILKTELESLYSPPSPERKEEFLQNLSYPQISFWEFLWIQFFYIGKMVWVGYIVLFFAGVFLGKFLMDKGFSRGMMAAFCAALPFVVALLASEVSKSVRFGMQELEMSARHRLEQVVLARLFLLSGAASLLIIGGCIFISWNSVAGVLPCIFYLTVPLLFNSVSSLWICRQIPSLELRDVSLGVGVVMAGVHIFAMERMDWMYKEAYLIFWMGISLVLAVILARQMKQYRKNLEVCVWN